MKIEEVGTIRYGNLKFVFHISEAVEEYLVERNISPELIFPKTQFFYQGVLMKAGVNHEEEKLLRVVFHGIRFEGSGVVEMVEGDFFRFENFPVHVDDLIYFCDFYVEVKDE